MSLNLMRETAGIPCMWMRGGSSKGGYFLAEDLPKDPKLRDGLLLRIMGSPDARQIDGMGGASPLTSKVAIVSKSDDPEADVDFLFLQVFVDEPLVSDAQPCGNILAGVGPFAIERGLIEGQLSQTPVRIRQINTGAIATAMVPTPGGQATYEGGVSISGVPGQGAGIDILMNVAPGKTAALLPTGRPVDTIDGTPCTLIDAGMPAVIMRADAFGLKGDESPDMLGYSTHIRHLIESIRLKAGAQMGLGDVSAASVPKMCLLSAPSEGTHVTTRCFIPSDVHKSLGVLCGISIIAAMALPEGPAAEIAPLPEGCDLNINLGHPTGHLALRVRRHGDQLSQAGTVRTARKLMDGVVFP